MYHYWGTVGGYCHLSDDMQSFVWPLGVVKLAYGDGIMINIVDLLSLQIYGKIL